MQIQNSFSSLILLILHRRRKLGVSFISLKHFKKEIKVVNQQSRYKRKFFDLYNEK